MSRFIGDNAFCVSFIVITAPGRGSPSFSTVTATCFSVVVAPSSDELVAALFSVRCKTTTVASFWLCRFVSTVADS